MGVFLRQFDLCVHGVNNPLLNSLFVNSTTKVVEELAEEADDKLFTNEQCTMCNKQRVLLHLTLPGTRDTKYYLRPRPHSFKLTTKNRSITECGFITRMLFKDVYWHYDRYNAILCIDIHFLPVSSFIYRYFITCLASCNSVAVCRPQ